MVFFLLLIRLKQLLFAQVKVKCGVKLFCLGHSRSVDFFEFVTFFKK